MVNKGEYEYKVIKWSIPVGIPSDTSHCFRNRPPFFRGRARSIELIPNGWVAVSCKIGDKDQAVSLELKLRRRKKRR